MVCGTEAGRSWMSQIDLSLDSENVGHGRAGENAPPSRMDNGYGRTDRAGRTYRTSRTESKGEADTTSRAGGTSR